MNSLVTIQNDDGWDDAAAENAERVIKGTLLKFSDWRWTKGKEGIEVEEGICACRSRHRGRLGEMARRKACRIRDATARKKVA